MEIKELLDRRICDIEENATNTQTYREFIRESEEEFGMKAMDLETASSMTIMEHLDFLDYLWDK